MSITALLDAVQVRTLFLRRHETLAVVTLITGLIKLLVLASTSIRKTGCLVQPLKKKSPEATSGLLNRSLLLWLNRLFYLGFRNDLHLSDLDEIDNALTSEHSGRKTQAAWDCRGLLNYNFQRDSSNPGLRSST